jgi:hypothetical protein
MLGDGVWEGLRVHQGKIAFLKDHLDRLWEGAAALDLDIGLSQSQLQNRLYDTLAANKMDEDVHIRLMVTRGLRSTPYQDPRVVISEASIVIAPEFKKSDPNTAENPLSLYTVSVRRGRADVQDPGLNSHSKINCITACIQAIKAGADEGLMLDPQPATRRISSSFGRTKFGRRAEIIVSGALRAGRSSTFAKRMTFLFSRRISVSQNVTARMKPSPLAPLQVWLQWAVLMAAK